MTNNRWELPYRSAVVINQLAEKEMLRVESAVSVRSYEEPYVRQDKVGFRCVVAVEISH